MAAAPAHVIVGASLAGAKAAEALRAEGYAGRIVLVGAELARPYERPPLSKQLLRDEVPDDSVFVHPATFYAEHDIDLRLGTRVTDIDVTSRTVGLEGDARLEYDRLLLATGARPRRLGLPGSDRTGIHYLRELGDVADLRHDLASARRVAVVGAGWIGSEVAASVRQLGLEVALIDPSLTPLARALGLQVGAVFRDLHAEHGVELHLGQPVQGFVGDRNGRVAGVVTDDGRTIDADLVVVGVGVEPRTELARAAGLELDGDGGPTDGIAVDSRLETSASGVFAAGDVAAAWHPWLGRRIRNEHWSNAVHQGTTAARNMLGADQPFDRLPTFFSDQYDVGLEHVGQPVSWDRVVLRGDVARREFLAFWLDHDRVEAAMNVNVWDVGDILHELVGRRRLVDPERLADPDLPLLECVAGGSDRARVGSQSLRA